MRNTIAKTLLVLTLAVSSQAYAGTVQYQVNSSEGQDASNSGFEGYKGETLFDDVQFIHGSDGTVNKLGKVDAGWYALTLTDFSFPNMFKELRVAITTSTKVVSILDLGDGLSQAVGYFELNNHDSYYLSVYGNTNNGGYGLYGVQLSEFVVSPVPLPASALLLFSGLMAWGASAWTRRMPG